MHPWIGPFLDALKQSGIQARACKRAGCTYGQVSALRKSDADFSAAFDDAMDEAVDRAEAAAWDRGVDGYEEPVVYQGQLTPVWARDVHGELILQPHETGALYPAGHDKAGEPIIEMRPVQARDVNGQPQWLTVRKFSDSLLTLVIKGRRKKVFADRTELTGADGADLNPIDDTARAARVAQLMAVAQKRRDLEDFV